MNKLYRIATAIAVASALGMSAGAASAASAPTSFSGSTIIFDLSMWREVF